MSTLELPANMTEAAGGAPRVEISRAAQQNRRSADVALLVAFLALVTGYVEGAFWLVRSEWMGRLTFLHPGTFWMTAAAQLALAAVPAAAFAFAVRRFRNWDVEAFAVTSWSFVCWLNLLALLPGLHSLAWVLLAAGLAATTGRLYQSRRVAFTRLARRSVKWLVVGIVAAAVVQSFRLRDREIVSDVTSAADLTARPNVLLVILDTVRADALDLTSIEGSSTPNLARLAARGTTFQRAWSTAPWTLPSTAGMLTGRLPHELSADWLAALDDRHATLPDVLAKRGWDTAGFVANLRYCSRETGLARGFEHFEGYRFTWCDFVESTALGRALLLGNLPVRAGWLDWPGRKRGGEITDGFLDWVDDRDGAPFCATLNYWDAHDPYVAPEAVRKHWPEDAGQQRMLRNWWWVEKTPVTSEHISLLRGTYDDCVRGLDDEIGRLVAGLESRGLLENTVLVITSDHGEHFGEHALFLHGNSLYEPLLHVPLIVVGEGRVPTGKRIAEPVSLAGLANTVFELAGADAEFPGGSWTRYWRPQADGAAPADKLLHDEPLYAELAAQPGFPPCHGRSPICAGPMQCVRRGNLKYIAGGNAGEALYDLATDGGEQRNLIAEPAYAEAAAQLRAALAER